MVDSFVHLHTHSSYSLLDGLGRIGDLVHAAGDRDMPALALTDHGVMFGAIEFYEKARGAGVKPIIGCEVYVADAPLEEKPTPQSRSYHLLLLAQNETGYRNLIRLTTEAHLRGFYRKPRVDHALLEQCSDGLICLSGCASSEVPSLILSGQMDAAVERADWYRQVFGDRYYMEIQDHGLEIDEPITDGVVRISRDLGVPLVATNDVHYVEAHHARTHEILLCIQTQTSMADPKRMKLETPQFYLKSAQEMQALFPDHPQALANSLAIAERCNLELAFGRPHLPRFQTPNGQSSEDHLRALCGEGLQRRFGTASDEVLRRLEYELGIILSTGFVDYFLLVHDVIHYARSRGIAVGPGRGSAAGSLVAYVLFLTNVDPIAHGLSFERFLNPERVSMPDMDLDFADDRRDEVIRYVTEKYGRDRVAQIITFGTLGPRAGVRDVGRVQGMAIQDVDRVAKLIPFACNKVSKAKEEVAELRQMYEGDSRIADLLDTVETLEGVARHASTHAAGVVISRDPLAEHVPLYKVPKNEQITTQYAMSSIEKIGLLKMDFLGLRTLTVIERAREFVRATRGVELDVDSIDLEDRSIYDLLCTGETFGVFQLDSAGMRRLLRDLQPETFEHIVAVNALYRPGPMDEIPKYVARRHGREQPTYAHPALEEVLKPTHGIVVYQEQVMSLFNRVAGYSLGEADLIRRAMAKKKVDELAKHHETFLQRAEERGTDRDAAQRMWDIVLPFAGYAFNKSHAAAYTLITCQTAYLKANYPREYLAGLMSAELENSDKLTEAMSECRRLGIDILPPDVNESGLDFTLEAQGIRFGLCAVKHVGAGAIEAILRARDDGGRFSNLEDFCSRVDWQVLNKRALESLSRCGAFDSLGVERSRFVASLDRIAAFGSELQKASLAGQVSLFGEGGGPQPVLQLAVTEPASLEERLEWEQELLGIYVSPHPLSTAEPQIREAGAVLASEVNPEGDGRKARVAGMIKALRSFSTRTGQPMATLQLTDLKSSLDVVVFSRSYERLSGRLADNIVAVVEGKVDSSDGRLRLVADDLLTVEEAQGKPFADVDNGRRSRSQGPGTAAAPAPESPVPIGPAHRLVIRLDRGENRITDLQTIERVYALLQEYPGSDEVEIHVRLGAHVRPLALPNGRVRACAELESQLRILLPESSWRLEEIRGATAA